MDGYSDRNMAGCCTACGEELAEVIEIWTSESAGRDSPLVGEVRRFGPMYDTAIRLAITLSDGTETNWTVCENCLPDINDNLAEIWKGVIKAFAFDWKAKPWMFGQTMNQEQLDFQARDLLRVASLAPLGILYSERWVDYFERENG